MASGSVAELLSFQTQIRNYLESSCGVLSGAGHREVARLSQVGAGHVGGATFAPSCATPAEVLHGSEGRFDHAIVCGVQHTGGVQPPAVPCIQDRGSNLLPC